MNQHAEQVHPSGANHSILSTLRTLVGSEYVLLGEPAREYAVDDKAPQAVVFPGSAQEVAEVLSFADANDLSVIARGGGTQLALGNAPRGVDIIVGLERLNRIVTHEPADMTVTVEAGMRLVDLQAELAKAGQFLPVDPPYGNAATVGGTLATRAFGPLRLAFRTIAESLLSVKVVTAQGQLVKAGAPVVKNVSGYDMGRLYTGSLGTLALIVEATFKVQPMARTKECLLVGCRSVGATADLVRTVLECGVEPSFIELIGPATADGHALGNVSELIGNLDEATRAVLAVGFMGTPEQVAWQLDTAEKALHQSGGASVGPMKRAKWEDAYPRILHSHAPKADGLTCRVQMQDSELYPFLEDLLSATDPLQGTFIGFAAHAGSGVARIHVACPQDAQGQDSLVPWIDTQRARAERVGGRFILENAPLWLKARMDVWGTPGDDFFLHRAVKDRMDPKGLLNPGRFVGGI